MLAYAIEQPAHGQVRVSNELRRRGIFVSASGVRSIWLRHELSSFKLRLVALEKQVAEKGIVLSDDQVAALERKQDDDVAHGEIETAHPGYLGSQDTFYVGTIKGVGRIYQQTFVDTYSKVAMAKLYTTKTPITAADLLNDRVLPFFEEHGMGVIRMLTDRGTEYCGKPESHDYQLYLALNDIEHTKTKARHPQTNGIENPPRHFAAYVFVDVHLPDAVDRVPQPRIGNYAKFVVWPPGLCGRGIAQLLVADRHQNLPLK